MHPREGHSGIVDFLQRLGGFATHAEGTRECEQVFAEDRVHIGERGGRNLEMARAEPSEGRVVEHRANLRVLHEFVEREHCVVGREDVRTGFVLGHKHER